MADAFVFDEAGLALVNRTIAEAMHELGTEAASLTFALAPRRTGRYRSSIGVTTYAAGKHFRGRSLKNIAQMGHGDVLTVVYTPSPLGHLLEYGSQQRIVRSKPDGPAMHFVTKSGDEVTTRRVVQPARPRRPHFGAAALQSVSRANVIFAARFGWRGR